MKNQAENFLAEKISEAEAIQPTTKEPMNNQDTINKDTTKEGTETDNTIELLRLKAGCNLGFQNL